MAPIIELYLSSSFPLCWRYESMWKTQSLTKEQVFKMHLGDPRERWLNFSDLLFSYSFLLPRKIHHNCILFTFPLSLESRWMYRPSMALFSWNLPLGWKIPIISFDEVLSIGERLKWTGKKWGQLWPQIFFFSDALFHKSGGFRNYIGSTSSDPSFQHLSCT